MYSHIRINVHKTIQPGFLYNETNNEQSAASLLANFTLTANSEQMENKFANDVIGITQ